MPKLFVNAYKAIGLLFGLMWVYGLVARATYYQRFGLGPNQVDSSFDASLTAAAPLGVCAVSGAVAALFAILSWRETQGYIGRPEYERLVVKFKWSTMVSGLMVLLLAGPIDVDQRVVGEWGFPLLLAWIGWAFTYLATAYLPSQVLPVTWPRGDRNFELMGISSMVLFLLLGSLHSVYSQANWVADRHASGRTDQGVVYQIFFPAAEAVQHGNECILLLGEVRGAWILWDVDREHVSLKPVESTELDQVPSGCNT